MAYTPPSQFDGDDKQNEQPALTGGTPAAPPVSGSTQAPAAPSMPSSSPGGPSQPAQQNAGRSGRWTNLQAIIGQNTGVANQVKTASDKALSGAKSDFDKEADPLRKAEFTANTDWKPVIESVTGNSPKVQQPTTTIPTSGNSVMRMGGTNYGGSISAPGSLQVSNADPFAKLKEMLTQTYDGPGAFTFDINGNKNVQNTDSLSNYRTAGKVLADGPYSAGASRLDAGIMGGSGDVRAVQDKTAANIGKFKTDTAKENADLNNKVQSFEDAAERARDEVAAGLSGYGSQLLGGIQERVDDANASSSADQANGVARDESGRIIRFGVPNGADIISDRYSYADPGQIMGEWKGAAPGSATIGNMVTGDETAKFALLYKLLGGEQFNVSDTGNYTPGGYTTTADPNYVAPTPPRAPTPVSKPSLDSAGGYSVGSPEWNNWAAQNPTEAKKILDEKEKIRDKKLAQRGDGN